jgi:hypothetical protein
MSNAQSEQSLSRRQFMKAAGLVSGVAGGAGLGLFGYAAGIDPNTYLGWQNEEGAVQTFNRKRFEVDQPTYEIVGPTSRPDARVEQLFERRGRFMRAWRTVREGGEFEEPLKSYYEAHPDVLELDRVNVEIVMPAQRADRAEYGDRFMLADAWSNAMGAVQPRPVSGPPDEWDFPQPRWDGSVPLPMRMKDPAKTAELIKKVSHQFGSTLVGITRLNPDYMGTQSAAAVLKTWTSRWNSRTIGSMPSWSGCLCRGIRCMRIRRLERQTTPIRGLASLRPGLQRSSMRWVIPRGRTLRAPVTISWYHR